ncbi:MAG: PilZ domain-containing protein [Candidatus Methylomirabilia bacterium]
MKHIALLRDDRLFWDDVARRLRDAHAKISTFGPKWSPEEVIRLSPDMIVTNAQNLRHLKIGLRRIPKVAIQADAQEAHLIPISRLEWNLEVVEWPACKDELLQITARQLAISPRKNFACIFRVLSDGDGAVAAAQTVNLSMTGLAFKAIAEFEIGQSIRIAIDLPGESRGLEAQARLIRSNAEDSGDPRTTYGAEYVNPSEQFKRSLKRFIYTY